MCDAWRAWFTFGRTPRWAAGWESDCTSSATKPPPRWASAGPASLRLPDARLVHANPVDAGAGRDVERLVIAIAEAEIGDEFGREDRAEVLAFRRHDPDSSRPGFPDVALRVHLHAVGNPAGGIRTHVDEHLAVGERVVALDVIAADIFVLAAVRVKIFLVRGKRQTVRSGDVLDRQSDLSIFPHEDAREIEFAAGIFLPAAQAAEAIREINRAVFFHDEVVRSAEALPVVAVGEDRALAVLLDAGDRADAPGGDEQAPLPVERQAVRSDHEENILAIGIGLRHAHAPDVVASVAAVVEIERDLSVRREFIDHVGVHV